MPDEVWLQRAVVTDADRSVGTALLRVLLATGCQTVALLTRREVASTFAPEIRVRRLQLVWGRSNNLMRLHSLLAIHEPDVLFHLGSLDERHLLNLVRAIHLYDCRLPLITLHCRPPQSTTPPSWEHLSVRYGIAEFEELFGHSSFCEQLDPKQDTNESGREQKPATGTSRSDDWADNPPRDYVHIDDAAHALLLLAETVAKQHRSLHVSFRSGWRFTPRQWLQLQQSVQRGETVAVDGVVGHVSQPLGWRPKLSLSEALQDVYGGASASRDLPSRHSPHSQRRAA